MAADVVRLEGVTKRYGRDRSVLDGVDLTLERGTVTHLVGLNGSGKSTLLRILAGVSSPTSGTVVRSGGQVGLVPEHGGIGAGLTVEEYLERMAAVSSVPAGSDRLEDLLERYGLDEFRDVATANLSKGTVKKVAIAQALLGPLDLLVLDEPADGLDRAAVARLRGDIADTVRAGAAVVLACHTTDLDELPVPTVRVGLADGHVTRLTVTDVAAAAAPMVLVEAQPPDDRPPVVRRLPEHEVDTYLARVLRAGGHVVRVVPAEEDA